MDKFAVGIKSWQVAFAPVAFGLCCLTTACTSSPSSPPSPTSHLSSLLLGDNAIQPITPGLTDFYAKDPLDGAKLSPPVFSPDSSSRDIVDIRNEEQGWQSSNYIDLFGGVESRILLGDKTRLSAYVSAGPGGSVNLGQLVINGGAIIIMPAAQPGAVNIQMNIWNGPQPVRQSFYTMQEKDLSPAVRWYMRAAREITGQALIQTASHRPPPPTGLPAQQTASRAPPVANGSVPVRGTEGIEITQLTALCHPDDDATRGRVDFYYHDANYSYHGYVDYYTSGLDVVDIRRLSDGAGFYGTGSWWLAAPLPQIQQGSFYGASGAQFDSFYYNVSGSPGGIFSLRELDYKMVSEGWQNKVSVIACGGSGSPNIIDEAASNLKAFLNLPYIFSLGHIPQLVP